MFGTKFLKEVLSSHYFIIPLLCLGALSLVQYDDTVAILVNNIVSWVL